MTNPTPLSPKAQAVWDAYKDASDGDYINGEWIQDHAGQIAAVIRAAANQVVPEREVPRGHIVDLGGCAVEVFPQSARGPIQRLRLLQDIRANLLSIAAELDGTNTTESPH